MEKHRDTLDDLFEKTRELLEEEYTENGVINYEKVQKDLIKKSQIFAIPFLANVLLSTSRIKKNWKIGPSLSNAAGMNKDAQVPPEFFKYLGFTRMQVGTVIGKPWPGYDTTNSRIIVDKEALNVYNRLGLPSEGPEIVARRVKRQIIRRVMPIDINIMSTPDPNFSLEDKLNDLEHTLITFHFLHTLRSKSRIILNFSCPNKESLDEIKYLESFIDKIKSILPRQDLYVKLGPVLSYPQAREIMNVSKNKVKGFIATNTDPTHGLNPFKDAGLPGGQSGYSLAKKSEEVQLILAVINRNDFNSNYSLIACGGILNRLDLKHRIEIPGTIGAELYSLLMLPNGFKEFKKIALARAHL